ncbi:hypothetical protein OSB04_029211 [Centaurea solstitialis]|uniref:GAG-pre-integrase domain-containing protein n=1 Tax=Centaurea solstitialis TaxID=347529 RepID=A0AA38W8H1_9ASTR|nr:hypothetical protein OSB04_029211 [Centaurea solstitialis]
MPYAQIFTNQDVKIARLKKEISSLEKDDPWGPSTNETPLIPVSRPTRPKLVLDPNVVYDVKLYDDMTDDMAGDVVDDVAGDMADDNINRFMIDSKRKTVLPKAPAIKQTSSTKPTASMSVKNNTEGEICAGTDKGKSVKPHASKVTQTRHSKPKYACGTVKPIQGLDFNSSSFEVGENSKPDQPLTSSKADFQKPSLVKGSRSIPVKPSSNSHLANNADGRTGYGAANVKTPRRRNRKKKDSFTAFLKKGGHDHSGLGYNPPSCNLNLNKKSVNLNRSANSNDFNAFRDHICSLFDNYMCGGLLVNSNSNPKSGNPIRGRRKRKSKQRTSQSVKSPTPKEESEKETSPRASSVTNEKAPMWLWDNHMWYFNSGAFRHVTGHRNILFDFIERAEGFVKLLNKRHKPILGYGSITNGKFIIKSVRYVEGLPYNLFSSSQFCDSGYLVTQLVIGSTVKDEDGNEVLRAQRNGHLYTTTFLAIPQQVESVILLAKATKEESWLWHQRLSHQNFKDMNKSVSKHLVKGLPETRLTKDTLCSACEKRENEEKLTSSKDGDKLSSSP